MSFVHLRTHTEFSVADGTLRIDDAVASAAADGQAALAITDLSNLFGAVKLYSAARKQGAQGFILFSYDAAIKDSEVNPNADYLNRVQEALQISKTK